MINRRRGGVIEKAHVMRTLMPSRAASQLWLLY